MNDKYYTPDILEFHVRFEYEELSGIDNETEDWSIKIFGKDISICELDIINNQIRENVIRVKYLDKDDIEELGWKYVTNFGDENNLNFEFNNYRLDYFINTRVIVIEGPESNWDDPDIRFKGIIKNKSELRKVMEMVGIKNK